MSSSADAAIVMGQDAISEPGSAEATKVVVEVVEDHEQPAEQATRAEDELAASQAAQTDALVQHCIKTIQQGRILPADVELAECLEALEEAERAAVLAAARKQMATSFAASNRSAPPPPEAYTYARIMAATLASSEVSPE